MTPDKSPQKIQTMFDIISDKYDLINNIMSLGLQKLIKKNSVKLLKIKPKDNILDLCCGTGDFAYIIKNGYPDVKVLGADFSQEMLKIAREKGKGVKFIHGDATNLPFEDNSFDFVIMGFGLRNIQDTEKALKEIYRILKYGGKFLHIDFGEKNILNSLFDRIIPNLTHILTKNSFAYRYLIDSKKTFPEPNNLVIEFENSGFKFLKRKDYLFKTISCLVMKK